MQEAQFSLWASQVPPNEFIENVKPLDGILVLVVDRSGSDETKLRCTSYPCSCDARWFELPIAAIESVRIVGLDKCCKRYHHVLSITLKAEFQSLKSLLRDWYQCTSSSSESRSEPDSSGLSRAIPLVERKVSVEHLGMAVQEKTATWPNDFNVGDCTLRAGHSITFRSNGTGVIRGYIKSTDTNDEWSGWYWCYNHQNLFVPPTIYSYYNMDGSSCTNRWCYWEQGFEYPAGNYPLIVSVTANARC